MVNVGGKMPTKREAIASGRIYLGSKASFLLYKDREPEFSEWDMI